MNNIETCPRKYVSFIVLSEPFVIGFRISISIACQSYLVYMFFIEYLLWLQGYVNMSNVNCKFINSIHKYFLPLHYYKKKTLITVNLDKEKNNSKIIYFLMYKICRIYQIYTQPHNFTTI